jgi:hypothetical protein
MTCRDIEQNLPAYLEDLLPEEEKDLIREHLASCRKCGKALEDLQRMEILLQNLEEVTPPPWLKQKILAQVKEEVHAEKGFFKILFNPVYFKIPLQTLALLVITVLAFYLYRGEGPELKKEGVDIVPPAAILQQQQRSEKREPFRMAPAQSASTQTESLEKSDKSVAAPSRYTRREPAPPPQKSPLREEIRPESVQPAQPADGAAVALKKEFPPEAEEWEKREKRKEKRFAGYQDSAKPGLQEHKIDEAQLKAQPHEFSSPLDQWKGTWKAAPRSRCVNRPHPPGSGTGTAKRNPPQLKRQRCATDIRKSRKSVSFCVSMMPKKSSPRFPERKKS